MPSDLEYEAPVRNPVAVPASLTSAGASSSPFVIRSAENVDADSAATPASSGGRPMGKAPDPWDYFATSSPYRFATSVLASPGDAAAPASSPAAAASTNDPIALATSTAVSEPATPVSDSAAGATSANTSARYGLPASLSRYGSGGGGGYGSGNRGPPPRPRREYGGGERMPTSGGWGSSVSEVVSVDDGQRGSAAAKSIEKISRKSKKLQRKLERMAAQSKKSTTPSRRRPRPPRSDNAKNGVGAAPSAGGDDDAFLALMDGGGNEGRRMAGPRGGISTKNARRSRSPGAMAAAVGSASISSDSDDIALDLAPDRTMFRRSEGRGGGPRSRERLSMSQLARDIGAVMDSDDGNDGIGVGDDDDDDDDDDGNLDDSDGLDVDELSNEILFEFGGGASVGIVPMRQDDRLPSLNDIMSDTSGDVVSDDFDDGDYSDDSMSLLERAYAESLQTANALSIASGAVAMAAAPSGGGDAEVDLGDNLDNDGGGDGFDSLVASFANSIGNLGAGHRVPASHDGGGGDDDVDDGGDDDDGGEVDMASAQMLSEMFALPVDRAVLALRYCRGNLDDTAIFLSTDAAAEVLQAYQAELEGGGGGGGGGGFGTLAGIQPVPGGLGGGGGGGYGNFDLGGGGNIIIDNDDGGEDDDVGQYFFG